MAKALNNVLGEVVSVSKDSGGGMTALVSYRGKTISVSLSGVNGITSSANKGDLVRLNGSQGNVVATPDYTNQRANKGLNGTSPDDFQWGNTKTGSNIVQKANGDTVSLTNGNWEVTVTGDNEITVSVNVTIKCVNATVKASKVVVESGDINLGGEGGKPIARVGDNVQITKGSSAGIWPIINGSSITKDSG